MHLIPIKSELALEVPKLCEICNRQAFGKHYGVLSCYACKMFFRRMSVQKLVYNCKWSNNCFETSPYPLKCQSCRFQRCLDAGMYLEVHENIVEFENGNQKVDELTTLLQNLLIMDSSRQHKLKTFYSFDNPSLAEILENPGVVTSINQGPNYEVTPEEWAFLAIYSHISYFLNFDFVNELHDIDKKIIFQHTILKLTYFCGVMRTVNEKRSKMMNPGGQEIYPDVILQLYEKSKSTLHRICCQPLDKLLEWEVTDEEYCLMNLLFFCNPAIPEISEDAVVKLSRQQNIYSNALFTLCQRNNEQTAPERFSNFISLYLTITKNSQEMENFFLIFNVHSPDFDFKKLVRETFHF
ncbi:Nuclear receptor domain-containing protein [Caenorhabditis elegans]|uniref:Nuclear receptor domain-containing protein n=1 Tax=Caenorhabditis elegans TaxID=6239 RepID=Q20916_CAEEL|nr:Nuclear receptor domain-containing protein [Caenorhabditis elegans]CAA94833.2 Nuclear receptor domain-containing protein [Caenorhabditis elegans]|eukprot:NP_505584.2 Nuclear Hormone Receptor family [Caenorhabditis elegans]